MESVNKSRLNNPWFICFIASLFFFYEFIQMTFLNSVSEPVMKSFSVDAAQLANLSACYFYMDALFLIPAGLLIDKYPTKWLLVLAMSCSVCGTLIFSFANQVYIAELSRLLSGMAGSFVFIGCVKLITRWFPLNKISFVIGLFITFGYIGGIVGQTPFTIISDHFGWHIALRFLAYFGILVIFLITVFVKSSPVDSTENRNQISPIKTKPLSLKDKISLACLNPYTWTGGLYTTLMNLPIIVLAALWSGLYLQEVDHFTNISSSFIVTALFFGVIIGSPLMGWLSDSVVRKKPIMLIGAIGSFLVILGIIFINNNSLLVVSTLFFLLGLFSSAQCMGYPIIIENNRLELTGLASSVGSILIMGAGSLLKVFFGWLLDLQWQGTMQNGIPIYSSYNFKVAFIIFPVAFVIATIIALLTRETASRHTQKTDIIY